jgi:hypothetical protein
MCEISSVACLRMGTIEGGAYVAISGSNGNQGEMRVVSSKDLAAQTAGSPHGAWRLSKSPALSVAFPNKASSGLGLPKLGA